jgi:LmbE family N-acetylglucosaminyl deacetylase
MLTRVHTRPESPRACRWPDLHLLAGVTLACAIGLASPTVRAGQPPAQPAAAPATPPPVEADTFLFREAGSRVWPVVLAGANEALTFNWPDESRARWDTALLSAQVRANGQSAAPWIQMSSGSVSARQYVRSGDVGWRWLNVGALGGALAPGSIVTLQGVGAELTAGPATLRVFSNRLDLNRSMLVLAPHPDDAEIAAFGLWAHRPRATVVTVTAGNAGPANYEAVVGDPIEHYQVKGRLRVIDSVTVPWIGGIPPERAFNMGYFDARLAEMHDDPARVVPELYGPNTDIGVYLPYNLGSLLPKRSRPSTWRHLVDDLDRILRRVRPSIIVAPHPQLDSHRDHQFTTVALSQAMARRRTRATLLLYTNHADQNRYPYGPAGTVIALPPPLPVGVKLDGVYSHAVSPEVQRLKLFALEAQHDLRPSPSRLYQLVVGDGRTEVPETIGPAANGGVNYLRRGPRANEIFFVYDQDTIQPMLAAFLDAWRARPVPSFVPGTIP